MIRLDSRAVVVLGSVVFALAAACSSAPPLNDLSEDESETTPTKKPAKDNSSSSSSGGSNNTSSSSSSGSTPTPPGDPQEPNTPAPAGNCAAEANADACFDCCAKGNEQGLDQAYQVFDTCACQTPGVCKTQCGNNYCAGQQPSAACETCLQGAQQCGQQADQACAANAQCKAAVDCFDASQCENK